MNTAALARTAALAGDITRSSMLLTLMDGRALTAGELARTAGVTPQTASGHLAKLLDAGLLVVNSQGRHRYFRIASDQVAEMVEALMRVCAPARMVKTGPRQPQMRFARTCYNHLAGVLAVSVVDAMIERDQLDLTHDGGALTGRGVELMTELGVNLRTTGNRAPFCRPCLDWSERRPHVAGRLGTRLLDHFLSQRWLTRAQTPRTLHLTVKGQQQFQSVFGLNAQSLCENTRYDCKEMTC